MAVQRAVYYFRVARKIWQGHADACAVALLNSTATQPDLSCAPQKPVVTENSVRSENTGVPIIREMMVATTMSSLFVGLFALVASNFRARDALRVEILALRHQLHHLRKFGLGYEQPSLSGGNPTSIVHLLLLLIFVLPEVMSGR